MVVSFNQRVNKQKAATVCFVPRLSEKERTSSQGHKKNNLEKDPEYLYR